MKKPPIVVGNWKMYKTSVQAADFIQTLRLKVTSPAWIAPPFTALYAARQAAEGSSLIIGAQNMSEHKEGAFTGEISGEMLKEAGAEFVLLGHSERRTIFLETDEKIQKKLQAALLCGLIPIVCVGETKEERALGKTEEVLKRQLHCAFQGVLDFSSIIVAYEPVWAIGTGATATPELIQEVHAFCRSQIPFHVPLLYGGSVSSKNVQQIVSQVDVDGVLVGGASLQVETFGDIIELSAEVVK